MSYGQDSGAYGRTAYTGADSYSNQTHSSAGYNTYDSQAAAASYQQYADSQATRQVEGVARAVPFLLTLSGCNSRVVIDLTHTLSEMA